MNYPCAKFGDFRFSQFGFIMQTDKIHTVTLTPCDTKSQTDAAKRFTPVIVVGVSKNF